MDTISFARKLGSRNKKKKKVVIASNQENESRIRKLLSISREARDWLNTGLKVSKLFR